MLCVSLTRRRAALIAPISTSCVRRAEVPREIPLRRRARDALRAHALDVRLVIARSSMASMRIPPARML